MRGYRISPGTAAVSTGVLEDAYNQYDWLRGFAYDESIGTSFSVIIGSTADLQSWNSGTYPSSIERDVVWLTPTSGYFDIMPQLPTVTPNQVRSQTYFVPNAKGNCGISGSLPTPARKQLFTHSRTFGTVFGASDYATGVWPGVSRRYFFTTADNLPDPSFPFIYTLRGEAKNVFGGGGGGSASGRATDRYNKRYVGVEKTASSLGAQPMLGVPWVPMEIAEDQPTMSYFDYIREANLVGSNVPRRVTATLPNGGITITEYADYSLNAFRSDVTTPWNNVQYGVGYALTDLDLDSYYFISQGVGGVIERVGWGPTIPLGFNDGIIDATKVRATYNIQLSLAYGREKQTATTWAGWAANQGRLFRYL